MSTSEPLPDFAMPDPKSRARVERILTGRFRPDDLANLFLYARDHCDGRESVADIGHFIAHHNERDKGIVTRSTREWFAVVRYHSVLMQQQNLLDGSRLPASAPDFFRSAAIRIDGRILKQATRLKRGQAHRMLTDIAGRLTGNADGTWALPYNITKPEKDLIIAVSGTIVSKPAFNGPSLFAEFAATLRSNGLISKEELSEHERRLNRLVQLFAVAAMHNCVVQIGDGTTSQLKGVVPNGGNTIDITAAVPVPNPTLPLAWGCSIFSTQLDPAEHCHPSLLDGRGWDFEVELDPDERLAPLG